MHKFIINMGDWSGDGHGKNDSFIIKCTSSVETCQTAYLESCIKLGFKFHNICNKYGDNKIPIDILEKLAQYGIRPKLEEGCICVDEFFKLIMAVISISEPIYWEIISNNTPNFNGYWGNLNVSFGYGLYG